MLKKFMVLGALVALFVLSGCNKVTSPDGNGDNNGDVFVAGGITVVDQENMQAMVWLSITEGTINGAPITNAVVIMNNDTLEYNAFAQSYFTNINYVPSSTYNFTIETELGNVSGSIQAPAVTSLAIVSPDDGITVNAGENLNVVWAIEGENSDSILLSYGYQEDAQDSSVSLSGDTRQFSIAGSNFYKNGSFDIWVSIYKNASLSGGASGSIITFSMVDNVTIDVYAPTR